MNEKENLVQACSEILGYEPAGIRTLLKLLSHPDVIEHTQSYFGSLSTAHRCLTYEAPWNCAREAEARFDSLHAALIMKGPDMGVGLDDWWCEPCRQRVLGG